MIANPHAKITFRDPTGHKYIFDRSSSEIPPLPKEVLPHPRGVTADDLIFMVKKAIEQGLSGIAVTDHNTIRGGVEAKKYETSDFEVIVGSEIMTDRGEVIGLFLSEEVKSKSFMFFIFSGRFL